MTRPSLAALVFVTGIGPLATDTYLPAMPAMARALGGSAAVSEKGNNYPAGLWQAYDRALALADAGRYDEAVQALQDLLARNKDFTPAERQLVALLEKMARR